MKTNTWKLTGLCCLGLALLLSACSKSNPNYFDYIAVQEKNSERWSILDVKTGELKVDGEFKERPSLVSPSGIFVVQNKKWAYDYYSIDNPNTPINDESYVDASAFYDDEFAVATLEGGCINIIDKKCKVIATFDKTVMEVGNFIDGYAIYANADHKYGFVDKKGNIKIKAQYDAITAFADGVFCSTTEEQGKNSTTTIATFYDMEGNKLFSFDSDKYQNFSAFQDGMMFAREADGNAVYALDKKGEKLFTVSKESDYSAYSFSYVDGYIIYVDGDQYGLKNKDNEVLVRAKYDGLVSAGDGKFVARRDDKWGMIDAEGNTVMPFDYEVLHPLNNDRLMGGKANNFDLINQEGKELSKVSFCDLSAWGYGSVKSNYIDVDEYAEQLAAKFTKTSFLNFRKGMTLDDFRSELTHSPSYYVGDRTMMVTADNGDNVTLGFVSTLVQRDYEYYYGYSFPSGYSFNYNNNLDYARYYVDLSNFKKGTGKAIAKAFDKILKNRGYEPLHGYIYKCNEGTCVGLGYSGNDIYLYYFFDTMPTQTVSRDGDESDDDVAEVVEEPAQPWDEDCDSAAVVEEVVVEDVAMEAE